MSSQCKLVIESRPQSVHIGTAGWTIPREFTTDFPAEGTHLERYARVVNCAEINSSFYRPHKQQTWERWRDSVPETFKFSVKPPKAITHEAKLECWREDLVTFLDQLKSLGRKLGPLLFQLPPSLNFHHAKTVNFLSMLRELHSGPVAWEPRHADWFSVEAEELFQRFQVSRVAADPACVPQASIPAGYTGLIYYRLHGSPRRYYSAYSSTFLESLAFETRKSQGEVWCIFDNTASGAAMGNVVELTRVLGKDYRVF